jgi:hypothetical protein
MSVDSMMTSPMTMDPWAWLERRLDGVPAELAAAMRTALERLEPGSAATPAEGLAHVALEELDSVLGAAEQDRRAALRLLAADALLTYAFEAAADPAAGGSAELAERLAERVGPRGALGARIAAIECPAE